MKKRTCSKKMAGFSLVEVAISLAIASFALLAVLGVVSVSQQSTKASSDDTRLSHISQQVFQTVQVALATNAAFTNPSTLTSSPWVSVTVNGQTEYQNQYWFDNQGAPLSSSTTPGAFYQATVRLGNLNTYPPNVDDPTNPEMLKGLVITINWPPSTWPSITTSSGTTPSTTPSRTYSMLLRNRGSYGYPYSVYKPPYP